MDSTSTHEGRLAVPGGAVWYRVVGHDLAGTPLLVIHGGPGAPCDYLEGLDVLADERPVIFYDQLGCGRSDHPDDPRLWNLERFVDELACLRAGLGLESVHLVGQSWGTTLAVEYVLSRSPAGVRSLVLSAPCLSVSRWQADQRAWLQLMPDEIRGTVERCEASGDYGSDDYQDAMMAFYRRHLCRLDPWPECLERTFDTIRQEVYMTMWGPSEFTVTGNLSGHERAERLGEIALPALFTCGEFDEATPGATRFYQSRLAGSECVVFEGASHQHHLEQPEAYAGVVRRFLARHE